jgi:hypothetical protein
LSFKNTILNLWFNSLSIRKNIFQNKDCLFLSSVLLINENGQIKDRILILFNNSLVVLAQNVNKPEEFDFEFRIPFISHSSKPIQLKRFTSIESLNMFYGSNLHNLNSFISKYTFELTDLDLKQSHENLVINRLLVICSNNYDFKHWIDLISIQINKYSQPPHQLSQNILNTTPLNNINTKTLKKNSTQITPVSEINTKMSPSTSFNNQNSVTKLLHMQKNNISPSTSNNSNMSQNNQRTKRVFSMRPHTALIPQFQLPSDTQQTSDNHQTIKRFMYKKAKASQLCGKCIFIQFFFV